MKTRQFLPRCILIHMDRNNFISKLLRVAAQHIKFMSPMKRTIIFVRPWDGRIGWKSREFFDPRVRPREHVAKDLESRPPLPIRCVERVFWSRPASRVALCHEILPFKMIPLAPDRKGRTIEEPNETRLR